MKSITLLAVLLLFIPIVSLSSETSLYSLSNRLYDQVKELDRVEQTINSMIQTREYKTIDDLILMSNVMHITRSANAVIIGQMELIGIDPCVTNYKVWYSSTVNQSINKKKSILYAMMLQMSELRKHISTKKILEFIEVSIENINAAIKLLDKALILTEENMRLKGKAK